MYAHIYWFWSLERLLSASYRAYVLYILPPLDFILQYVPARFL